MWPHLSPRNNDLNTLESTLPENTFTQVTQATQEKDYKRIFLCTPILKFDPFLWTHSSPRDHDLNKYVSFSG